MSGLNACARCLLRYYSPFFFSYGNLPLHVCLSSPTDSFLILASCSADDFVMAAAEARAAWQRTANRCFVQEDAKRAPKLACCPSSSSSSKLQSEPSCGDAADVPNHPATFLPFNWNPSYSNLPPDTKWWLQLQPSFAHQKDLTHEQPSSLSELEGSRNDDTMPASKQKEGPLSTEVDQDKSSGSLLEPQRSVSVTRMKHDSEARFQELKAGNSNNKPLLQQKADMSEWVGNQKDYMDEELMDWESIDVLISNQPTKACLGMESSWIWSDRTEPWWRTDKDELASLVAQKSLYNIENCDLPRPQIMHVQGGQFACLESSNRNAILASSLDQQKHSGPCTPNEHAQCSPVSVNMAGEHCPLSEIPHSYIDSERSFRYHFRFLCLFVFQFHYFPMLVSFRHEKYACIFFNFD